jgi:hypothetical protein
MNQFFGYAFAIQANNQTSAISPETNLFFYKLWLPFCKQQWALTPERSDGMSCTQ